MAKINKCKTITFSPSEYACLQEVSEAIHTLWSEMASTETIAGNSEYTVGEVDDFLTDLIDSLATNKDADENYTIALLER